MKFATMDFEKTRVMFQYEFRRGNASQRARNINDVYGPNIINARTVLYWFNSRTLYL